MEWRTGAEKKNFFEGATKLVTSPDEQGFIFKYFKKGINFPSFEEQNRLLELKKHYFGSYIPKTELYTINEHEYYIKQQYIPGKLLSQVAVDQLSTETIGDLLDLLRKYLSYAKKEKQHIDLTGYQHDLQGMPIWYRRFRNFLKIYKNFLVSTNIIISEEGKIFMIDVCDSDQDTISFYSKVKNFCAKPFVHHTLSQLSALSQGNKAKLLKTLKRKR